MTTTTETAPGSPLRTLGKVPVYVWLLAGLGGIAGVLLAEPGDFLGNTVPSALTFLIAGLALGLVGWGVTALARRRGAPR